MKNLIIGSVVALALGSALAAPASTTPASQPKAQSAASAVVGVWRSDERTAQVSPGTLTLSANGRVSLAPDGFDPLVGTYKVQGRFLDITTDRGTVSIVYTLSPNGLMLEYENGSVQNFKKQVAGRSGTPTIKKDAQK
jgi:uncharacterized membrane protein